MRPKKHPSSLRIGIDIGGTFTDFVVFDPSAGKLTTFKLPSTPADPAEAVLSGLQKLGIGDQNQDPAFLDNPSTSKPFVTIIHGSTVATNAFLERKGAVTALITTRGFKDVLQIGRQNRPQLYDFNSAPPQPLIPSELRFELDERVDHQGTVLTPLNEKQILEIVAHLKAKSLQLPIESVAVVFLFSFTNPQHEKLVADSLRAEGFFVSASYEILPEYREYERTSTTVINAYVSPVLDRYLAKLEQSLSSLPIRLQVMQSNGGSISLKEARKAGVRCILSGPAGGVVGCQYIGKMHQSFDQLTQHYIGRAPDHPNDPLKLLTFDMGGTSTDVSLIDSQPKVTCEAEVGGLPLRIPLLDIHTIGAGGGSIATVDAGGILRVGPESAGADPGPACYGGYLAGGHVPALTITDAHLFLGRILADQFLGGEIPLYPERTQAAIAPIAHSLGLTPAQTALGVLEIANAHMERALRVISVERGYDPREFTLLSFGGAGGLHAADLARRLSIPRVLISPYASTLSAFGMLVSDVVKDYTQTVMLPGETTFQQISTRLAPMIERGHQEIQSEGFTPPNITIESYLDMRYQGQSYELTIPFSKEFVNHFHQEHFRTYGYQRPEANLEIVNLRIRATGIVTPPPIAPQPLGNIDPSPALIEHRPVILGSGNQRSIPFYRGEALQPGNHIPGPAIILRKDTTILIDSADLAKIDPYSNVLISISLKTP